MSKIRKIESQLKRVQLEVANVKRAVAKIPRRPVIIESVPISKLSAKERKIIREALLDLKEGRAEKVA